MANAVKFTFGNAFDDAGRKAQEQAEERKRSELSAMRAQAFDNGFEAGRQQALAGIEAELEASCSAMAAAISAQVQALDVAKADLLSQSAELARLIGERLAGHLIEQAPLEAIAELVTRAFAVAAHEPRLVVRVADTLLDAVKARSEALAAAHGYAGRMIFLAEPAMARGDVRVEWADGGAERRLGAQIAELDRLVAAFVAGHLPECGDS